jgi:hypothetical protein
VPAHGYLGLTIWQVCEIFGIVAAAALCNTSRMTAVLRTRRPRRQRCTFARTGGRSSLRPVRAPRVFSDSPEPDALLCVGTPHAPVKRRTPEGC